MKRMDVWFFMQYSSNKKSIYPKKPFDLKMFFDFDEMKTYSAKQAAIYHNPVDPYYPEYCSDYVKSEIFA